MRSELQQTEEQYILMYKLMNEPMDGRTIHNMRVSIIEYQRGKTKLFGNFNFKFPYTELDIHKFFLYCSFIDDMDDYRNVLEDICTNLKIDVYYEMILDIVIQKKQMI